MLEETGRENWLGNDGQIYCVITLQHWVETKRFSSDGKPHRVRGKTDAVLENGGALTPHGPEALKIIETDVIIRKIGQ